MAKDSIAILAYHEVSKITERRKIKRTMGPSCSISDRKFSQHLSIISDNNIETITFNDILLRAANKAMLKHKAIITFDDGHIGNYFLAFPNIYQRNQKAVFFVTTNFIGSPKMMTWQQLKEMSSLGMSIQSHCVSHTPLETLSEEGVKEELSNSKKIIENHLGKEVTAVSLPHGSVHHYITRIAAETGYKYICTSEVGYFVNNNALDVQLVPRIPVSDLLSSVDFRSIITHKGTIIKRWALMYKVKLFIKDTIGINNYRRIYRFIHNIKTN